MVITITFFSFTTIKKKIWKRMFDFNGVQGMILFKQWLQNSMDNLKVKFDFGFE